jgi:tetratricopeptide (TPR) repeat protein
VRPGIPAEVQQVIDKALAKVPADRFRSVDDLARALRGSSTGGGSPRGRPDRRRAGRRRWIIAPLVVLALFGAGYAALQLMDGGLREDDWLLVADFTGPPNDPRLADDVRDLVTDAFRQSRFVRLFERRQLNEAMRNASVPETTFVNADLARQLAVRSSVRGVLIGNVTQSGTADAYTVSLNVLGTDQELEIAGVTGTATRATLIETVQQLAGELREELGERRSAVAANRPLRDVTTPSFEAFRKYAASLDVVAMRNDYPASKALLREAIALDTAFASAWAALGAMYTSTRQLDSARIAYARASAFPQRLSVAEGYRLKANIAYAIDHDLEAAVRWYELYLEEVPHSRSGRGNRAVYLTGLGRYDEALSELRTALANHPFGPELAQPTILNLAAVLTAVGRVDEARAQREHLSGAAAQYMDIMLATALSDWRGVERIVAGMGVDRAPAFLRIQAATSHSSALAARGKVGAADSVLQVAVAGARGEERRWYERARLLLAVVSEQPVVSRRDIAAGDTAAAATMLRALWAAVAGDTISARRGLTELRDLSARDSALLGNGLALIEGWIAAQRGDWRRVVDLLGPEALQGEHEPTFLDPPDSFAFRWLVATAHERLGRPDSAALHLGMILRPTGYPPGHFALRGIPNGFAHRKLAMNLERAGNLRDAGRHLDLFVTAFSDADSSLEALVADARAARERVARGQAARGGG